MINVAFLLNFPKEYKGGINYIKNLMYACSKVESSVNIFLFVPSEIEQEYITLFSPYATIVKTQLLNRKSVPWFIEKVIEKLFKKNIFLHSLFKQYKIDVVSHSNYFNKTDTIKIINWIPDFQCLHYPDLWTAKELKATLGLYKKIVEYSDKVVLSSFDAMKDFKQFASHDLNKAHVLQFVSQPSVESTQDEAEITSQLFDYGVNRPFFYLPNQFWSHKNHLTAFKAIKILKDNGLEPLLVTTGFMNDYRSNNQTFNILSNFIEENNLRDNILLLGLIPYHQVLSLFKAAKAVINPSFFEGWSSSVEESKSIGQTIILSNINVHVEQSPKKGIYFDPSDSVQLAGIMRNVLLSQNEADKKVDFQQAQLDLQQRTLDFGSNYCNLIKDIVK
jgi:glycosyltransferase involved in cell wall biosynthesis